VLLTQQQFTAAVEALPLVSLDLCLLNERNEMLLGKRLNRPAQGWWFSPGGRIRKSEPWPDALNRIAVEELGLHASILDNAQLMGVWDHFYDDNAHDPDVSTHYVNLPHFLRATSSEIYDLTLPLGEQHSEWCWMPVLEAINCENVHPYVRLYAQWIKDQQR